MALFGFGKRPEKPGARTHTIVPYDPFKSGHKRLAQHIMTYIPDDWPEHARALMEWFSRKPKVYPLGHPLCTDPRVKVVPYEPFKSGHKRLTHHIMTYIPDDWPDHARALSEALVTLEGTAAGFEQNDAGLFVPTPLQFEPNTPNCFWDWEGGVPLRGQQAAKEIMELEVGGLLSTERLKGLFVGPAGLGKTTIAWIVADMLIRRRGGRFFEILSTQIASLKDFENFVRGLQENDVVFIDEIHIVPETIGVEPLLHILADEAGPPRLKVGNEEYMVPRTVSWIGGTTDPGRMDKTTGGALRRRFDPIIRLEPYDVDTIVQILHDRKMPIDDDAAYDIAERSHGMAWLALSFYKMAGKAARVDGSERIEMTHVQRVFNLRGIDAKGLGHEEISVLRVLLRSPKRMANGQLKYAMSQAGVVAASGVDPDTYLGQVQPRLMQLGLLTTNAGQCLTERGVEEYGWLA